jgi:hypothetical protein
MKGIDAGTVGPDVRPCELIARLLREKCWEEFVRSDGCRDESDPVVVGDASQTKSAIRRRKTSEFATTFIKRKVDRSECRNRCGIDSCEDGARKNAHTSRIKVSYEEPRRMAQKRRRDDRVRQGSDEARAAR